MKLKSLLAMTLTSMSLIASASQEELCLRVGMTDGSATLFKVAEGMTWNLSGDCLSVQSPEPERQKTFQIADVSELSYVVGSENSLTAGETFPVVIRLTADGFVIENAPGGSRCRVCDMRGRVVAECGFDNAVTIGRLGAATYVVTVNDSKPLKIMVK